MKAVKRAAKLSSPDTVWLCPSDHGARYDSYAGLDVKDKIVLILRYVPENVEPARRAQLNRYAGLRYKAMLARERGAKAVLVVTGPNSPNAGEVVPLTNDFTNSASGIIAASISGKTADALLAPSGKTLKAIPDRARQRKSARQDHVRFAEGESETRMRRRAFEEERREVVAYIPPAPNRAVTNTCWSARITIISATAAAARSIAPAKKTRFIPARMTMRPAWPG